MSKPATLPGERYRGLAMASSIRPKFACLAVALCFGCSGAPLAPSRPADPLVVQASAEIGTKAIELLSELIRIDTTKPGRRRVEALERLGRFLSEQGVKTELVPLGEGRTSLIARLPGMDDGTAGPVVLLSHLDTAGAEARDWPGDRPAWGGVITSDGVWGRGALRGKGPAVVHAAAMGLLSQAGSKLARDVLLVVTTDGIYEGRAIQQLIQQRGALLRATVVLGEGGMNVVDQFSEGWITHGVAIGEKGLVLIRLTAEGPSTPNPLDRLTAPERLSRALLRIEQRRSGARVTAPVTETLGAVARALPFPRRWTLASRPFASVFELGGLARAPATRELVTDTVQTISLASGSESVSVPHRARAILRCLVLPDTSPGALVLELRAVINDQRVLLNILHGEESTVSPVDPAALDRIVRQLPVGQARREMIAPILGIEPTDLRFFRRHRVPAYGVSPFVMSAEDQASLRGSGEHVSQENLNRGIRFIHALVQSWASGETLD
jgi:carboxypeptidase PM20D1